MNLEKTYRWLLAIALMVGIFSLGLAIRATCFTRRPANLILRLQRHDSRVGWDPAGSPLTILNSPSDYILAGPWLKSSEVQILNSTVPISVSTQGPVRIGTSAMRLSPSESYHNPSVSMLGISWDETYLRTDYSRYDPLAGPSGFRDIEPADVPEASGSDLFSAPDYDFCLFSTDVITFGLRSVVSQEAVIATKGNIEITDEKGLHQYIFTEEQQFLRVLLPVTFALTTTFFCDLTMLFHSIPDEPFYASGVEVFDPVGEMTIGAASPQKIAGLGHYIRTTTDLSDVLNTGMQLRYSSTELVVTGKSDNLLWNDTQLIQTPFEKLSPEVRAVFYGAAISAIFTVGGAFLRYLAKRQPTDAMMRGEPVPLSQEFTVFHLVDGQLLAAQSYSERGLIRRRYVLFRPIECISGQWYSTYSSHRIVPEGAVVQYHKNVAE